MDLQIFPNSVQPPHRAAKVVAFKKIDYAGTDHISGDLERTAMKDGQTQVAPIMNPLSLCGTSSIHLLHAMAVSDICRINRAVGMDCTT